jgi:hypothetical protein
VEDMQLRIRFNYTAVGGSFVHKTTWKYHLMMHVCNMLWHLFHCPHVPSTGSSSLSPTGTHSERMHHSPSPHGVPSAHGMCWVLHLIQYKCGIGNTAKNVNDICRIHFNNLCFFKVNFNWIQRHFTVVLHGFAPLLVSNICMWRRARVEGSCYSVLRHSVCVLI